MVPAGREEAERVAAMTQLLTDSAIRRIQEMIIAGELRPGDRLPPEKDLATALGLARNSLREAIRALTYLNILETRRGSGTYVTSLSPRLLLNTMGFVVDLHSDELAREYLEVRRALEVDAAARAAVHMGVQDQDQLYRLNRRMRELSRESVFDAASFLDLDRQFHQAIAMAAQNSVLLALIELLGGWTTQVRHRRVLKESGTATRAVEQHEAMIIAIVERDPAAASARASVHILEAEDWLRAQGESRLADAPRPASRRSVKPGSRSLPGLDSRSTTSRPAVHPDDRWAPSTGDSSRRTSAPQR
jgi:DNA-binding FadR family transcriptional regulator